MADSLFQALGEALDKLQQIIALNFPESPAAAVPMLCIHPPALRKAAYDDISRELQEVDARLKAVVSLKSEMDGLVRKLAGRRNALESMLVPISALPDELLSDIFSTAAHSSPGISSAFIAANISLVCRGWHDVSMALPQIWDQISVPLRRIPLLKPLETRMGKDGIYLTVFQPPPIPEAYSLANRISRLVVDDLKERNTIFAPLFGETKCSTSLQTLSLFPTVEAHNSNEAQPKMDISMYSFPALSKLEINYITLAGFPKATNLRHLQISSLPCLDQRWWTQLLHNFPLLDRISVRKVHDVEPFAIPTFSSERLVDLKHFEASQTGRPALVILLSIMNAPNLTHLSLDDTTYNDTSTDMIIDDDVDDAREGTNNRPIAREWMSRTWQGVIRQTMTQSIRLTTIKLRSRADTLINLLIPLRPVSKTSTHPYILVPYLEELSLLMLPGEYPPKSELIAKILSNTLAAREKMGNRLSLLKVTSCVADAMGSSFQSFASDTSTIPCSCAELCGVFGGRISTAPHAPHEAHTQT